MRFDVYEYRNQGRHPGTYLAFGLGLAICHLVTRAPAGVGGSLEGTLQAVMALGLALFALAILALNPAAGLRIRDGWFEVFSGPDLQRIPLARIRRATRVRRWPGTVWRLELSDGTVLELPPGALPRPDRLAREFRARGVPVSP
ncbi:hypothetical protein [Phaeovulum vinaykumarii]|uniref:PH domain-containing protein n=1 Tax=Phaeovulum vinaykumarii TaxID=407234 RepID=A0A1N7LLV0_9RHOB|nr:hypothetical protein [Phaeovulum vinaykumarii]SIS74825.1 hypothetical protein SAMN05421795_103227 [Phaeovulum vinaykumarii]SOC05288.1 hypothetical protein SAMN05878426_103227 [Phaeovulum vinaykumarii]